MTGVVGDCISSREKDKNLVRSMIRPERLDEFNEKVPRYFLLDGQQRVTVLASVTLNRQRFKALLSEMEDGLGVVFCQMLTGELSLKQIEPVKSCRGT